MQAQHQQQQGQQQDGGGYGGGHGQQQAQGHMGQGPAGQMGGQGFHPNFGAWGINDTTAQLGMQLGQSAVAAGQDYVQKNFATLLPQQTLKHHFNVSNSYVLSKMRLLLFPWMHKPWARRTKRVDVQGGGANHEWCTPREDVNSPDLYIPVMAIVTYILLTGLHAGINSTKGFKPQILGESTSRATLVVMFDFLFVKLVCYILNIPTLAPSASTSSFAPSSQLVDLRLHRLQIRRRDRDALGWVPRTEGCTVVGRVCLLFLGKRVLHAPFPPLPCPPRPLHRHPRLLRRVHGQPRTEAEEDHVLVYRGVYAGSVYGGVG